MVVGVCRIVLSLPGANSLKEKRSTLRRVVDRTANSFNVAIAEVDAQDTHRRAVIGFAVVSSDRRHANSMLDNIANYMGSVSEAIVSDQSIELVSFNDLGEW